MNLTELFSCPEIRQYFNNFDKKVLDQLPSSLIAEALGQSNEVTARFEVDFFENRVVTYFNNKVHTHELSKVLAGRPMEITREYAEVICPKMGFKDGLLKGIKTTYIGRCILGLAKSMDTGSHTLIAQESEFVRIIYLIKGIQPIIYSPPIM